jgi:endonuclease/exonuclease/phosphatase family metal-dependent hydrolase
MLFRNREQNEAFEFIAKTDFDIFCIQEVPQELLSRLQTLSYHMAFRIDTERIVGNVITPMYLVTLSRFPLTNEREFTYPEYWRLLPLRTKLFVNIMPSALFARIRNRGGLAVDAETPSGRMRIFNLHLILAQPRWRLDEFKFAMNGFDKSIPTIICGDFNVLEKPHITPLNWILGGEILDTILYKRERARIEKCFRGYALINPLRGFRTHNLSRSQLDHILVSDTFSVKNASVLPNRHGSDHHPICVTVT